MTTFQGSLGHRLSGPKMRVDPNNPDIVYAGNMTGVFFVTYNGGENWTRIDPLLARLALRADKRGLRTRGYHPLIPFKPRNRGRRGMEERRMGPSSPTT